MVIVAIGASVTVTVAWPLAAPTVLVIVAVPGATPVTVPEEFTDATLSAELVQVVAGTVVQFCDDGTDDRDPVPPTISDKDDGETTTEFTTQGLTGSLPHAARKARTTTLANTARRCDCGAHRCFGGAAHARAR
jgi:hypothetical protein